MKNPSQSINQSSGRVELYTPPEIINLVHQLYGQVDLDPASNPIANQLVNAKHIFTLADNGLQQRWFGKVWMNHPFSRFERACPVPRRKCKKKVCKTRGFHLDEDNPGNTAWIQKFIAEYINGDVTEGLCITFMNSSEDWFKPLPKYLVR